MLAPARLAWPLADTGWSQSRQGSLDKAREHLESSHHRWVEDLLHLLYLATPQGLRQAGAHLGRPLVLPHLRGLREKAGRT